MAEPTIKTPCPICGREIAVSVSVERPDRPLNPALASESKVTLSFDPVLEHIERHKQDPDTGVWPEAEIRDALIGWGAAQAVNVSVLDSALKGDGDVRDAAYQKGLADGYVGALQMVLTPLRKRS